MLNTEHLSSNKLIKHVDNIKSLVIENELLKYIIKSLKKRLESDKKLEVEAQQPIEFKSKNELSNYMSFKKQQQPNQLSNYMSFKKQQPRHTQIYDNDNNNNNMSYKKQKLSDVLSSPYKYDKQQKLPYFESNPYKYEIKRNSKPKLLIILRKKNII